MIPLLATCEASAPVLWVMPLTTGRPTRAWQKAAQARPDLWTHSPEKCRDALVYHRSLVLEQHGSFLLYEFWPLARVAMTQAVSTCTYFVVFAHFELQPCPSAYFLIFIRQGHQCVLFELQIQIYLLTSKSLPKSILRT